LSNPNGFGVGPSFDNFTTITYTGLADVEELKITSSTINSGVGSFNRDFQIGDNELASIPLGFYDENGNLDMDSIIKIRTKAQNTWSNPA
jgi:hypothetical protein